jgi:hypothetical protein
MENSNENADFFSFLQNLDITQNDQVNFKQFLQQCVLFQNYNFTNPVLIEMRKNLLFGNTQYENNYLMHLVWYLKSLQTDNIYLCETLLNVFNIFHSPLSQVKKEKTQLLDIHGNPYENIKNDFNFRLVLKMTNLDKDITNRNHVLHYLESNEYQLKCKKPLSGKIYSTDFLKVIDNMNVNPNEFKQIACVLKINTLHTFNDQIQNYISKNIQESGENLLKTYDQIVCGLVKTSFSAEYYNNFYYLLNLSNCEEFKNLYFYPAFLKFAPP